MEHKSNPENLILAKKIESWFEKDLAQNSVVLYGRKSCMKTAELEFKLVYAVNQAIHVVRIDHSGKDEELAYEALFERLLGHKDLPIVFINQTYIGKWEHVLPMIHSNVGTLEKVMSEDLQYDICVIGGGSCGLTAAIEASQYFTVALCDWNMSTRQDNEEGLGNASKLNMELLPKYFLHRELFMHKKKGDWATLIGVLNKKLQDLALDNWEKIMTNDGVRYYNGRAKILDSHTVRITRASGLSQIVTANKIIIATGTEIVEKKIKCSELGITVDQLFKLQDPPGNTLILGETMKCLEVAGILKAMDVNCTVMPTRCCDFVFDKEILNELWTHEEKMGITLHAKYKVTMLTKAPKPTEGLLVEGVDNMGEKFSELFDTVVFANIRTGRTKMLGLENVGLEVNKKNQKIVADMDGNTDNPSVFVTGSVLDSPHTCCIENATGVQNTLNLIRSFRMKKPMYMKKESLARIVLTPIEYGTIGYTEEKAITIFGPDDINTYKTHIGPYSVKLVCVKELVDPIVGIHVLGFRTSDFLQSFVSCIFKGINKGEVKEFESVFVVEDDEENETD